ncbi:MAG: DMT family transporter [Oligoflexia bacterium]|nr:DMT family transporter [Oligoflexia bacterium]
MSSLGPICAFLSSLTWAVGSAGYSQLARRHSAFAVNFSRALVALPLFVLAVFVGAGGWTPGLESFGELRLSHVSWLSLSMFASYGFGDVLFLWSTRHLGVPGALAIASSYPLWTAGAAFLFGGESLGAARLIGILTCVGGVCLVILGGARERGRVVEAVLWKGVALALLTSVFWATNSYAVAHAGQDLSSAVGNVVRMVIAMLISSVTGRLLQPHAPIRLPTPELRRWLWLFALEAFGGSYFFMYGLSHSPLAVAATLSSLAPVISVPVAWMLGLERFSLPRTIGVCLVVTGIWVLMAGA